jgi:hypothetical protein
VIKTFAVASAAFIIHLLPCPSGKFRHVQIFDDVLTPMSSRNQ